MSGAWHCPCVARQRLGLARLLGDFGNLFDWPVPGKRVQAPLRLQPFHVAAIRFPLSIGHFAAEHHPADHDRRTGVGSPSRGLCFFRRVERDFGPDPGVQMAPGRRTLASRTDPRLARVTRKKKISQLAWREYLPLAATAASWAVIVLAIGHADAA